MEIRENAVGMADPPPSSSGGSNALLGMLQDVKEEMVRLGVSDLDGLMKKRAEREREVVKQFNKVKARAQAENRIMEQYDEKKAERQKKPRIDKIPKNDIDQVKTLKQHKFLAVIGAPGTGKQSTLIQTTMAGKVMVFHLRLLQLDYTLQLSVKQLLIDEVAKTFDEKTREHGFQWVIRNQDKVAIVLEGYDRKTIDKVKPISAPYYAKLPMQQIITNLCYKKYFPDALLVCTAECYFTFSVPDELMPDTRIYSQQLPFAEIQTFFYIYTNHEEKQLWAVLKGVAPHLVDLCNTPMIAQLTAWVGMHDGLKHVMSVTSVFESITKNMTYIEGTTGPPIHTLLEPLSKMAYTAQKDKEAIYQMCNFEEVGLKMEEIQNLIVPIACTDGLTSRKLMEGKQLMAFIHHIFQEWFAALYICKYMSYEEFKSMMKDLATDYYGMVRLFMCGILLGEGRKVKTDKQRHFRDCLLGFFETVSIDKQRGQTARWMDILIDLLECSNEIKDLFSANCADDIDLVDVQATVSASHALGQFISRVSRLINRVNLLYCRVTEQSLERICEGIRLMRGRINCLNLSYHEIENYQASSLNRCKEKIEMMGCDMNDAQPQDVAKAKMNAQLTKALGMAMEHTGSISQGK